MTRVNSDEPARGARGHSACPRRYYFHTHQSPFSFISIAHIIAELRSILTRLRKVVYLLVRISKPDRSRCSNLHCHVVLQACNQIYALERMYHKRQIQLHSSGNSVQFLHPRGSPATSVIIIAGNAATSPRRSLHPCRRLPLTNHTTHLLVSLIMFYCK